MVSENNVKMVPVIPACSKIIFPGDHTPVWKVISQDAKILKDMQEKLKCLLNTFEDIMSSSSCYISHTKLIEMNMETDPNLPPVTSKPYTLSLSHQEWVRKELEDLEKAGIIQRSLSPYALAVVIVPKISTRFTNTRNKKILCGLQKARHTIPYSPWK